jgi:hypothetical protein
MPKLVQISADSTRSRNCVAIDAEGRSGVVRPSRTEAGRSTSSGNVSALSSSSDDGEEALMAQVVQRTWRSGPRKVRKSAWGYTLQVNGKQERKYDARSV